MASHWVTVRVFISSTFRDMHAERDFLVKVTFPRLRQWCEERRIHLVDVDLRWGVTAEQAEGGGATEVCLEQIDRCRPFFLCLLGQRYGWMPDRLPEKVQHRFAVTRRLQRASVTHLEIAHALAGDQLSPLFYFRDASCLPPPRSLRWWQRLARWLLGRSSSSVSQDAYEQTYFEQSPRAVRLLAQLKDSLYRQFASGGRVAEYRGQWDPDAENPEDERFRGRLTHLESLGERVEADLQRWISSVHRDHLAALARTDLLAEEASLHEAFLESRTQVHVPRHETEAQLTQYAHGADDRPLLLSGPAGAGKSSLLAHWCRGAVAGLQPLVRFVGASPVSVSPARLVANLWAELTARRGLSDRLGPAPKDPATLFNEFPRMLTEVAATGPLLIVIDALDQFEGAGNGSGLDWLPPRLPAGVRLVVSALEPSVCLDALRRRSLPEVRVPLLNDRDRRQMLHDLPNLFSKQLDERQTNLLLDNPATRNPLFLTVALNELRVFGSFERMTAEIRSLPGGDGTSAGDALDALFERVLARLEAETARSAPGLASALFTFLAASQQGLAEVELEGLLARELPALSEAARHGTLQVILRQVRPYLLRRGQRRGALVDFYHRSFREAALRRYLADAPTRARRHLDLAAWFLDQPHFLSEQSPNARKLVELPWQLVQASLAGADVHAALDPLAALLTDPVFWEAMLAEEGLGLTALEECLRQALVPTLSWRKEVCAGLRAIARVLAICSARLASGPKLTAPVVFAALQAEERPESGVLHALGRRIEQAWRESHPELAWYEDVNAVGGLLASAETRRLSGHHAAVNCCVSNPDGSRLLTAAADGEVIVWEPSTGRRVSVLRCRGGALSATVSPDGRLGLIGTTNGVLHLLDLEAASWIRHWQTPDGPIGTVAFVRDRGVASIGCWSRRVRFWNPDDGRDLGSFPISQAGCAAFSNDGTIATGTLQGRLHLWDPFTGEECFHRDVSPWPIDWCSYCPDGTRLLIGSGGTVTLWSVADGTLLATLSDTGETATTGAFNGSSGWDVLLGSQTGGLSLWRLSPDQISETPLRSPGPARSDVSRAATCCTVTSTGTLVAGWKDGTIRVWDADDVRQLETIPNRLRRETTRVAWQPGEPVVHLADRFFSPELYRPVGEAIALTAVALSPNGTKAFLGYTHGLVRVVDPESGMIRARFRAHRDAVTALASVSGNRVVSVGTDGTIRLWDIESGRQLWGFEGPVIRYWSFDGMGRHAVTLHEGEVLAWDLEAGRAVARLETGIRATACATGGKLAAVGDEGGRLFVWESGRLVCRINAHQGPVQVCSVTGDRVLTVAQDGLLLWEIPSGRILAGFALPSAETVAARLREGGDATLTLDLSGTLRLWNLTTNECVAFHATESGSTLLAADADLHWALVGGIGAEPQVLRRSGVVLEPRTCESTPARRAA